MNPTALRRACGLFLFSALLLPPALAQWNPPAGQWGKLDGSDLRVMTWNVKDALCRTNTKHEGTNNWTALARIVAAMRPDVLVLEECGDNSGNGTGSGVDTVSQLATTVDLFLHGGSDPYLGGQVTAYVQAYAPGYDLPHVFVSSETDNYNRNVLLSRYPFADLNGDGVSTQSDIPHVSSHLYAPGGDGGIRGFQFVEIDLDDAVYTGDLVVGGAHLKAGSSGSDHDQRVDAARNVAYYVDYLLNGAGTGVPDPYGKIADSPAASAILGADTPVVLAGDWNEDELTNGQKGPAEWLANAQQTGGTDGTDRDRSDSTYDGATQFFTGSRSTYGSSGSKLDYVAWQDSIAAQRLAFVFDTVGTPSGAMPPELSGYPSPGSASDMASDHRPVIVDLELPLVPVLATAFCFGDSTGGPCPCLNWGGPGEGCANSLGYGAILAVTGSNDVANDDLVLHASQARPDKPGLFIQGDASIELPFKDGLLCTGAPTERLQVVVLDWIGYAPSTISIVAEGHVVAGQTKYYQFWYRDGGGPCGQGSNLTNGQIVTWR